MTWPRVRWSLVTALSLLVVLVASRYLQLDPETYFPEQRTVYLEREGVLLMHVIGGMVALAAGPFQLAASMRDRRPRTHRFLGRAYLGGVLVGGAGGFLLAPHAFGGAVSTWGFGWLAVLWVATTLRAAQEAIRGNFDRHRRWAMASLALTFAAVTLRLWLGVAGALGIPFDVAYPVIAWACWVPNLAFAVWWTRRITSRPEVRRWRLATAP